MRNLMISQCKMVLLVIVSLGGTADVIVDAKVLPLYSMVLDAVSYSNGLAIFGQDLGESKHLAFERIEHC